MRTAALALGITGAIITIGAAIYLWRMDPEDDRYAVVALFGGGNTGGLRRLIDDQGKAAAATAVGGAMQLLGLLLSFLGETP